MSSIIEAIANVSACEVVQVAKRWFTDCKWLQYTMLSLCLLLERKLPFKGICMDTLRHASTWYPVNLNKHQRGLSFSSHIFVTVNVHL